MTSRVARGVRTKDSVVTGNCISSPGRSESNCPSRVSPSKQTLHHSPQTSAPTLGVTRLIPIYHTHVHSVGKTWRRRLETAPAPGTLSPLLPPRPRPPASRFWSIAPRPSCAPTPALRLSSQRGHWSDRHQRKAGAIHQLSPAQQHPGHTGRPRHPNPQSRPVSTHSVRRPCSKLGSGRSPSLESDQWHVMEGTCGLLASSSCGRTCVCSFLACCAMARALVSLLEDGTARSKASHLGPNHVTPARSQPTAPTQTGGSSAKSNETTSTT